MSEQYLQLLSGLANYLGLPSPEDFLASEELVINGQNIGFVFEPLDPNEPEAGDVLLFAVLGAPPAHRQSDIYRLLLEANNLWSGTSGATLGLQQDTGNVVMATRLPVEGLLAEQLAGILETFLDTALFWKATVAGEPTTTTSAASHQHFDLRA